MTCNSVGSHNCLPQLSKETYKIGCSGLNLAVLSTATVIYGLMLTGVIPTHLPSGIGWGFLHCAFGVGLVICTLVYANDFYIVYKHPETSKIDPCRDAVCAFHCLSIVLDCVKN